eukprot:TRINITY_DN5816_c0_g1_i1.p1 TRINITY_DN5816_c0_g1~~TRINITY_DN5816_c0_g1_i1.p1  ORF type:complete len:310 (+),score=89.03 TRINITY_DN5816_c0_g1_i1:89-931(+)
MAGGRRGWTAPALPNSYENCPCSHNSWDNVRVKKEKVTLRCRVCQLQWKLGYDELGFKQRCAEFGTHGRCRQGDACSFVHVHKWKQSLQKRQEIWGSELLLPRRQAEADRPGPRGTGSSSACTSTAPAVDDDNEPDDTDMPELCAAECGEKTAPSNKDCQVQVGPQRDLSPPTCKATSMDGGFVQAPQQPGIYQVPVLQKHFPSGTVVLQQQPLMVFPGGGTTCMAPQIVPFNTAGHMLGYAVVGFGAVDARGSMPQVIQHNMDNTKQGTPPANAFCGYL